MRILNFVEVLILRIQLFFWSRKHTIKDLEKRLVDLGCTKTATRNSIILTTPNGKGKIEIKGSHVFINPQLGKHKQR